MNQLITNMKSSLLLSFLFITAMVNAQPVLTRSNYFDIGDSLLLYNKFDTSLNSISPGPDGANITWDFSAVDFNHPSVIVDTVFYIDPVGTPFYPTSMSADYSQSNLCFLVKTDPFSPFNSDYNYLFADNDSVSFIGHWANGGGTDLWEDHCTDFIKELSFPLTYSSAYIDSFQRFYFDMSGSDEHYINGTISVTADGYGTLITPDGSTVQNVLRLHTVESFRDSNVVFGINNYTYHSYQWYSADMKGYLLRFNMDVTDTTLVVNAFYQKQTNLNTSVEEPGIASDAVRVFPNPGNEILNVVSQFNEGTILIYDQFGRNFIKQLLRKGKNEIDLSRLLPGVYFVKSVSCEKEIVQKFVVY
jgi:hypothetical protein